MTVLAIQALASCVSPPGPARVRAVPVPLPLEFAAEVAEFSGLAWLGERLLILPQYPESLEAGVIWTLHADSIARAVAEVRAGHPVRPLRPEPMQAETEHLVLDIPDYDGLEALAIDGWRWFALVEYGHPGGQTWGSRLVTGWVDPGPEAKLRYGALASTALEGAQIRPNFTHEALLVVSGECWVLAELNAPAIVDLPVALRFSSTLEFLGTASMPPVEYRITDATAPDEEGRFHVLNLFWPPDAPVIAPALDGDPVERLLPLRIEGETIQLDASRPVIDLRESAAAPMHNWEGVARFRGEGFLLVSDSYPADLLAFVDAPE